MPTVAVDKTPFLAAIGRPAMTNPEVEELCFQFGIELDDVVDPAAVAAAAAAADKKTKKGKAPKEKKSKSDASEAPSSAAAAPLGDIVFKIDIPANRYDLLCFEGLTRALRVFLGLITPPAYTLGAPPEGSARQRLTIEPSTASIRPHAVCAVLRGVSFTPARYQSFIDLQDKLHQNICRKRTLVAIGTHDLSKIRGPFTYSAQSPDDIKFVALSRTAETTARELMQLYATDEAYMHLRPYLPIISHSPVYPVIHDADGHVLSMPPIINGERSKIDLNTRDVFIECTATDLTRARIVLNIMCCMFAEYCTTPFSIEPCDVVHADGSTPVTQTPVLTERDTQITMRDVRRLVDLPDLTPDRVASLLAKMMLRASVSADDAETIEVQVPPTRPDILHVCDVAEDVAVAYGFDNIPRILPPTVTTGSMQPLNKLTDQLRTELALAGFTEALNFTLLSHDDNFTHMRRTESPLLRPIKIANPKTLEFQEVRTSLLPGLFKTCASNLRLPLPLRLFEAGDVVLHDATTETQSRNERRIAALHMGQRAEFETIHGLLDRIMQVLNIAYTPDSDEGYHIAGCDDEPLFFGNQSAAVWLRGRRIGVVGAVHPHVLKNFKLSLPCSVFEIVVQDIFKK